MDFGRANSWHDRYGSDPDGICNFKANYDFYFKWLLDKVMQIFVIKDDSESEYDTSTINFDYFKSNLLLDGDICITDFNEKLYAVTGNLGGEPDEYYIPTVYTVANPILGSKMVYRKDWKNNAKTGVVIFNSDIDSLGWAAGPSRGLFDLIHQTATLLADNIVSINCQQINSRVHVFFTVEDGDGENKAEAGAETLRKMYSGRPYQVLKEDLFGSIKVNPVSSSSVANNITQLVELQNFIIANFFQSIGVKANNVMKRERLITAEIDEQNDYVALSLLECITSWEKGLREVNDFYGTDLHVELNPVLLKEIADQFGTGETPAIAEEEPEPSESVQDAISEPEEEPVVSDTDEAVESDTEESDAPESVSEQIEQLEEVVDEVIETIIDDDTEEGGELDVENGES